MRRWRPDRRRRSSVGRHHPGRVGILHRREHRRSTTWTMRACCAGTQRLTPEPDAAERSHRRGAVGASRAGRSGDPRDLWVAIATEYVFRLPTVHLAAAHSGAARPGVGTYCYLFTWESPLFGGILGSCHALDIPFVFGTVHNPAVQTFSGGGAEAFELSAKVREAWVMFARTGSREMATLGSARPGRPGCSGRGPGTGEWSSRSDGHGKRSWRPWQRSSMPGRPSRPSRPRRTEPLRGRSPIGRGRALKPPPVRVRLPPSPPISTDQECERSVTGPDRRPG